MRHQGIYGRQLGLIAKLQQLHCWCLQASSLSLQVRQYNNGTLSCLLHSDESRGVRDGSHHYNVSLAAGIPPLGPSAMAIL